MYRSIFIFVFLSVFGIATISAQDSTLSTKQQIQELYSLWNSSVNSYQTDLVKGDFALVTEFFKKKESFLQNKKELKASITLKEGEVIGKDLGLSFNSSYVENFTPGLGEDETSIYDRRVLAGVSWDILKSGFFSNKREKEIKHNSAEIHFQQASEATKLQNRIYKWQNLIYSFNKQKVNILKKRLILAEQRVKIATQLSYLKLVTQKELITNVTSLAEIQSMFNIYQSYNEQLYPQVDTMVNTANFPLVDIDYTYSLKKLQKPNNDTVVALMVQNLELENKFLNTVSLSTFLRYNYYDLAALNTEGSRSFYSLGLQLKVPLAFDRKAKNDLMNAKKEYMTSFPLEKKDSRERDILNYFYEFKYKLKQFTNTYHKHLLYKELIRREKAKYEVVYLAFNPIDALQLQDDLMKIDIELLDLKQQMYLKLLSIYTELPQVEIEKLLVPFTLTDIETEMASSKSVYVWSKTLAKNSPQFISNYLQLNKITTAIISLNTKNSSKINFNKVTTILSSNNINSTLLIGRNRLINEDFDTYIASKTKNIDLSKITAIHLDVEPHTFDDWQENKEAYLNKLIALASTAKLFCDKNKLKLELSIPLHYPENKVKELYNNCDKIYFMAYENVKTSYILKKISPFKMEKTVIALRTNDFENRLKLEEKILELKTQINPIEFAIHDLQSLINFDK